LLKHELLPARPPIVGRARQGKVASNFICPQKSSKNIALGIPTALAQALLVQVAPPLFKKGKFACSQQLLRHSCC
jgi:hypothetical protein